jgi:GxxExxY protein
VLHALHGETLLAGCRKRNAESTREVKPLQHWRFHTGFNPAFCRVSVAQCLRSQAAVTVITSPLAEKVIGCAIDVHRVLGPGLLESAYEFCLTHELQLSAVNFRRQVAVPVVYKGTHLDCGYRVDFVVDDVLLVELKSIDKLQPIHSAQVLTYMRLLGLHQGLLMNFNNQRLVDGLKSLLL